MTEGSRRGRGFPASRARGHCSAWPEAAMAKLWPKSETRASERLRGAQSETWRRAKDQGSKPRIPLHCANAAQAADCVRADETTASACTAALTSLRNFEAGAVPVGLGPWGNVQSGAGLPADRPPASNAGMICTRTGLCRRKWCPTRGAV